MNIYFQKKMQKGIHAEKMVQQEENGRVKKKERERNDFKNHC